MSNLNEQSWDLTKTALIRNKTEPYSVKQLRKILFLLKEKGFDYCLRVCKEYNPNENKFNEKKINEDFLNKLDELSKGKTEKEMVELMRQTLLNLRNLSAINKLRDRKKIVFEQLLKAEGLNENKVQDLLKLIREKYRNSNLNPNKAFYKPKNFKKAKPMWRNY